MNGISKLFSYIIPNNTMKDILKAKRFFYTNPSEAIVRTPEELAREMISKIPGHILESSTSTFLDPACGKGTFLRIIAITLKEKGHSEENIKSRIFGIDIDVRSGVKQPQHFFGKDNVIIDDFLSMNKPKEWPERFDVIVSNPPYSKKLDLKFLEKSIDISSSEIIFVHPASFLVDGKGICKEYISAREKSRALLESITFFNGNPVFGIDQYAPCTITHLSKNSKSEYFDFKYSVYNQNLKIKKSDISGISNFGYSESLNTFKEKVSKAISKGGTLHQAGNFIGGGGKDHLKVLKDSNSFFVEFTHIRGHAESKNTERMVKDDFFTIVKRDVSVSSGRNPNYNIWFEFTTESEANNFIAYVKSDFARACLATVKMNQHLARGEMKFIPLVDFKVEWNPAKIYSHFGITEKEQEFIKEIIPPYYD